jgi:dienelactone hydrolase
MVDYKVSKGLLAIGFIIAALTGLLFFSETRSAMNSNSWSVKDDGFLEYSVCIPKYNISPSEMDNKSTLFEVTFISRNAQIAGLLRIPKPKEGEDIQRKRIPGIVLLPGATVTKEREQMLAKYLCSLGFATMTFDQRNLGVIDAKGDLQLFLHGLEPIEHKMVYDALAAAEIMRDQPKIDPARIIYVGESNGGRFAIIACALDARARGVLVISTCGYGTDAAVTKGILKDPELIRFYRSIDPETYLDKLPPRPFVMIHSLNDTIIPHEYAEETYTKGFQPKVFHIVSCRTHGYCTEMNSGLEKELKIIAS